MDYLIGIVSFALILGVLHLMTSTTWMNRLRRRLAGVGAWFPLVVWLVTFASFVLALADPRRIGLPLEAGLFLVAGTPFFATVLTLAWRDTQRGEVEVDPDADDEDRVVSDGLRVASAVFATLCAVGIVVAGADGEWRDAALMLFMGLMFGRVAVTGRAPGQFRGSV